MLFWTPVKSPGRVWGPVCTAHWGLFEEGTRDGECPSRSWDWGNPASRDVWKGHSSSGDCWLSRPCESSTTLGGRVAVRHPGESRPQERGTATDESGHREAGWEGSSNGDWWRGESRGVGTRECRASGSLGESTARGVTGRRDRECRVVSGGGGTVSGGGGSDGE